MFDITPELKPLRLAVPMAVGLLVGTRAWSVMAVGPVIGGIDGMTQDSDQVFISGWACQ